MKTKIFSSHRRQQQVQQSRVLYVNSHVSNAVKKPRKDGHDLEQKNIFSYPLIKSHENHLCVHRLYLQTIKYWTVPSNKYCPIYIGFKWLRICTLTLASRT